MSHCLAPSISMHACPSISVLSVNQLNFLKVEQQIAPKRTSDTMKTSLILMKRQNKHRRIAPCVTIAGNMFNLTRPYQLSREVVHD